MTSDRIASLLGELERAREHCQPCCGEVAAPLVAVQGGLPRLNLLDAATEAALAVVSCRTHCPALAPLIAIINGCTTAADWPAACLAAGDHAGPAA